MKTESKKTKLVVRTLNTKDLKDIKAGTGGANTHVA
jgi:hypothetical protein